MRKFESETRQHNRFIETLLVLSPFALAVFVRFGFSLDVKRLIKEAAHGKCKECGKYVGYKNLVAAHHYHYYAGQDTLLYDKPGNGRALCRRCETIFHIKHIDNPEKIGMENAKENAEAVWGNYFRLPRPVQLRLKREYFHQLNSITQYLHNGRSW